MNSFLIWRISVWFSLLWISIHISAESTAGFGDDTSSIDFNRDIRPILSDNCFFCHGPDPGHREADLRLDIEAEAKDEAIVAGEPLDSELFLRISSQDEGEQMPPVESGKKLSGDEINRLKLWIEQGAQYAPHWAYVPPRRYAVPKVSDAEWPAHWIDRFVLARLEAEGLAPSPDADRVTLIRRLNFDLTGLPPTPQEVATFVADADPRAYEETVDRLLDSEAYAERMAMYWLDLVRYADTVGYHGDQDHNISPYRDYVIDAFNENLAVRPVYSRTIGGRPADRGGHRSENCHGLQPAAANFPRRRRPAGEYLAIYAADRVRNVSSVWMGGTMGCCQCHDHKYDPYTTQRLLFAWSLSLPTLTRQSISRRDRTRCRPRGHRRWMY